MGRRLDNARGLYLDAIRDGHAAEAIAQYSGERYTQHSTPVKDGPEGFVEFFDDFYDRNSIRDIEIVRSFEDGRYVFLHVVQTLNHGEYRYVTADIFDTDADGKLIEHWDIIAEMVGDNSSGHGQVDGPTEPTDLDKTEQNRALVREFVTEVQMHGETDKLTDYLSANTYVEHSPTGGQEIVVTELHNVIGSGSLVAVLSRIIRAGVDSAVIDLYRVADGRIIEHWDVIEAITPEDTWVNSGKF